MDLIVRLCPHHAHIGPLDVRLNGQVLPLQELPTHTGYRTFKGSIPLLTNFADRSDDHGISITGFTHGSLRTWNEGWVCATLDGMEAVPRNGTKWRILMNRANGAAERCLLALWHSETKA